MGDADADTSALAGEDARSASIDSDAGEAGGDWRDHGVQGVGAEKRPAAGRELVQQNYRAAFIEDLPLNYDETTLDTIEQIDVLWLNKMLKKPIGGSDFY